MGEGRDQSDAVGVVLEQSYDEGVVHNTVGVVHGVGVVCSEVQYRVVGVAQSLVAGVAQYHAVGVAQYHVVGVARGIDGTLIKQENL